MLLIYIILAIIPFLYTQEVKEALHVVSLSTLEEKNIFDHKTEICSAIQPGGDHNETEEIHIGQVVEFNDKSCVKYYSFKLEDEAMRDKYLHIELVLKNVTSNIKYNPILQMRKNKRPYIYYEKNGTVDQESDIMDINGYFNRKEYHNIVIEPKDLKDFDIDKDIYISFYNYPETEDKFLDIRSRFTLTVTAKDEYPCPQDCTNNGICKDGVCICDEGMFDLDCTVEAKLLKTGKFSKKKLPPFSWGYFYFSLDNIEDDIKISFQKNEGNISIAMLFIEKEQYYLSNFGLNYGTYTLQRSDIEDEILITNDDIVEKQTPGARFMIGAFNEGDNSNNFEIKVELTKESTFARTTIMYVMIGVSTILIILWGIITVIKYKVHRENEVLIAIQQAQARAQREVISKEDLEKYFPKTAYNKLKTTFEQTTCSICLDDFAAATVCRQIYCEHIYHDTCIEAWLSNHNNCPNCKKDITKQAVEDHFKEQKAKQGGGVKAEENGDIENNKDANISKILEEVDEEEKQDNTPYNIPIETNKEEVVDRNGGVRSSGMNFNPLTKKNSLRKITSGSITSLRQPSEDQQKNHGDGLKEISLE